MKKDFAASVPYAAVFCLCACAVWLAFSEIGRALLLFLGLMGIAVFLIYLICGLLSEKRSPSSRIIFSGLASAIALWVLVYLLLSALSYSAIFFPNSDVKAQQTLSGKVLPGEYEPFSIEDDSGTVSGWHMGTTEENRPLVLYFGGNFENASSHIQKMLLTPLEQEPFEGCGFLMCDMPGYGDSSGYPSERTIKSYALRVYDAAVQRYRPSKIMIMGFSIGTGAANYTASQRRCDGLILYAPYADGYDLYNSRLNIFYGPMRLCVAYKMEAFRFAEDIGVKPLVIYSFADEVIPPSSTQRLCRYYPKGCRNVIRDNVSHSYFWSDASTLAETRDYIQEVTGSEAA